MYLLNVLCTNYSKKKIHLLTYLYVYLTVIYIVLNDLL